MTWREDVGLLPQTAQNPGPVHVPCFYLLGSTKLKHADSKSDGFIEIGPVVPEIPMSSNKQTLHHYIKICYNCKFTKFLFSDLLLLIMIDTIKLFFHVSGISIIYKNSIIYINVISISLHQSIFFIPLADVPLR